MNIVVNARLLRKNDMDGIGWFTYHTLKLIVKTNPNIDFHFLFDSRNYNDFLFGDNVHPHVLFPPAKHAFLNIAFFQGAVTLFLKKYNPNLFLSLDGNLSLHYHGKQYGVIHDISFLHFPQDLKPTNAWYYNTYFPKFANKATRLGTVSEYSKNDIVTNYKVAKDKIDVLYCGLNEVFENNNVFKTENIKAKYTNGVDYFLFVGTLHPRKNIVRLIQAFEIFKGRTNPSFKLLIVGKTIYGADAMNQAYESSKCKEDIVFTGRLNDNEIKSAYTSAFALVFVPHFEGFGIPILEAMSLGVPVIASNTTSMPEVVGDAALLANPFNVEDIAKQMSEIYLNNNLRELLIVKGKERAKFFSWENTANKLWAGIEKLL